MDSDEGVRAAIYSRVSTEEQKRGWSLESQYEDNRAYCAERGYEVVRVLEDVGSGASFDRPAFAQLMRCAKKGRIDRIVIWRMDRFGRDPPWTMLISRDLEDRGIPIETVANGVRGESPESWLYRYMQFGIDRYESLKTAERCQTGRETAAQNGQWPGGRTPYGLEMDEGEGTLAIVEEEAEEVRRCFVLAAEDLTTREIAEHVDLNRKQIGRYIRNEAYRGALVYGEVVTENAWPAIVDPALWQKANDMFDKRIRDVMGREPPEYVDWSPSTGSTAQTS